LALGPHLFTTLKDVQPGKYKVMARIPSSGDSEPAIKSDPVTVTLGDREHRTFDINDDSEERLQGGIAESISRRSSYQFAGSCTIQAAVNATLQGTGCTGERPRYW